ncbi:MAG: ion transporter [Mycobacteriaceae bacterium]|nr:ion transporter [Mycobacteriaceae bacterium]
MTSESKSDAGHRHPNDGATSSSLLDWTMLALAAVSVGLLAWIAAVPVAAETHRRVVTVDQVICAIFAAEFLWRWRRAGWDRRFPLFYWYDLIGMIPVSNAFLRGLRLLRIVVVVARRWRRSEHAAVNRLVAVVVGRVTTAVVAEIKRPITIAVLDEVADVLQTGHYTRNLAAALAENRQELDSLILELIRNDRTAGRLKWVPFHDDVVRLIADTTFRIVFQVLADPRTDELVSDLLRENIEQIRKSVRDQYETQRLGRTEVAAALDRARRRGEP